MYTDVDSARGEERLDSRDLIELRATLASELEYTSADSVPSREELAECIAEIDELAEADIADWQYGEQLIREDCFEQYAQELAEDIGAIDRDAQWPQTCIDWERAASELAYDYTIVSFLGYDYYVRS